VRASVLAIAASFAIELAAVRARSTEADAGTLAASSAAEQVAAEGYDLQAAGRYAEAVAAYLRAYDLSSASAALINVATLYDRRLHEPALAAAYYQRYVAAPDAEPDLVARANARLAALATGREPPDAAPASSDAANVPPGPVAPASSASEAPAALSPPSSRVSVPGGAPPPVRTGSARKTLGLVVGGTGIASVGASLVLGAMAMVKDRDADMMCKGSVCSGEDGVRLAEESGRLATASTIAFFAGLALAGGGLTVILTAPKSSAAMAAEGTAVTALTLSPALGRDAAGLTLNAGF
jgi:hypothetical protein